MSKETQAISNDINQLTNHARALVVATADVANEQVTEAELASRIVLAKRWPLLISGSSGVMLASFSCLTRPLTSPLSTLAILKATHQECAKWRTIYARGNLGGNGLCQNRRSRTRMGTFSPS